MRIATIVLILCGSAARAHAQSDAIADSLALRLLDASGGAEVWAEVPYIVFEYKTTVDGNPSRIARHLWNRVTNQYRLEIPGPSASPYVVLMDLDTRDGEAYWFGDRLTGRDAQLQLENAYRRFVNDSFWLLAPLRLFDAGVERTYVPELATETAEVLRITFTLPERAPAETYWLFVDRATGLIARWDYRAPHDAADAAPRAFEWLSYNRYRTPAGLLTLSSYKRGLGRAIEVRTNVQLPREIPDDWFTSGLPKLWPTTDEGQ